MVGVSVAEKKTVNRRPVVVKEPGHRRYEWAVCEVGFEWQSCIKHDAGGAGGYLNASAPDLAGAAVDDDAHDNRLAAGPV